MDTVLTNAPTINLVKNFNPKKSLSLIFKITFTLGGKKSFNSKAIAKIH